MDGLDLSAIDQIDDNAFGMSSPDSDDDEDDLPPPDCIGIDSALEDSEKDARKSKCDTTNSDTKSRCEIERELELRALPNRSIRKQILERSLNDGHNRVNGLNDDIKANNEAPTTSRGHVMNIVEKAGMSGIDKGRINEIIHEASKGSLFYKKQAQRQEEIHKSIEKMLNKVKLATPIQVENAKISCDKMLEDLEKQRVFNRIIVHFDLDMFFAAVEIRDNPELADKPVAVGGDSMVSTSNYIARRFGVRAAMPGFIAKKLCPDLVLIKPNGYKYRQASAEIFEILEQYDPELTSMSLDEAYLDLSDYVRGRLEQEGHELLEYYDGTLPKIWWQRASEVVQEIRAAIYDKTKLTCSAGIACNTLLAKISTDIKKPNGQFMIEGYPNPVGDFIRKTPVEKVSGIGKVSAQFLNALDIKTCGDIYDKRYFLPLVFYEINTRFYLRVALGDGSTSLKSDEHRKSKSVERTFSAVKETVILLDKLDSICDELCNKYLRPYRIRGRTVTVKLKRNTFNTTTKSYSLLVPTNDKLVIYQAAKNLLMSEIANEPPEISYRLLGVKLSNLADDGVTTNQVTIDALLRNQTMHDRSNDQAPILQAAEVNEHEQRSIEGESSNSSSSSVKRSHPETETDEFACAQQTEPETNERPAKMMRKLEALGHIGDVDEDCIQTESVLDNINDSSQEERRQNDPNHEDFQCPYCFKPYSDFTVLEQHVGNCYLKTSIDVYKQIAASQSSQRANPRTQVSSVAASQKPVAARRRSTASQSVSTRKSAPKKDYQDIATLLTQPSQAVSQTYDQTASPPSAQKISYYDKFVTSNSQSLSLSPKIEPFQCPYCLHGFLTFDSIQNHAKMCSKKQ